MPPNDFVSRGQALVASGQYQEAVKVCRLGLLGRPTEVHGRLVLAQALLALRRYDEVLAEMRVALELDGAMAAAHGLKGEALLRKGDMHAAREALIRARELAPGDPAIAALYAENEVALANGGPRLPTVDPAADPQTKHYPSHKGFVAGGPGSSSFTRPDVASKDGLTKAGQRTPPRKATIRAVASSVRSVRSASGNGRCRARGMTRRAFRRCGADAPQADSRLACSGSPTRTISGPRRSSAPSAPRALRWDAA